MRHKKLFPIMLAAIIFGGCQESAQVSSQFKVSLHANYLHPEQTDFSFQNAQGGTMQFSIQSQETPWRIDNVPDWLTVSPTSGSATTTVTLTVPENVRANPRSCLLNLTSTSEDWTYSKTISVNQPGATPYAEMDQTEFIFDGKAHTVAVAARSNFDWKLSGTNVGWVSAVYDDANGVVNISGPANDTPEERSAQVNVVFSNQVYTTFYVVQAAAEVSVTSEPLNYTINGGSYTITVSSEAPWKTSTNLSWLDISPTSGAAGTTTVTVSTSPNPHNESRGGFLYFQFSSSSKQIAAIEAHQDGVLLDLDDQDLYNLPAVSGTFPYVLTSNVNWEITQVPDFMTITPKSGSGTKTVNIKMKDNPTFDAKTGTLRVKRADSDYYRDYNVRQRSRVPEFTPENMWLSCNDLEQTLPLKVDTFGPWYISYERDFFDMTPTSASGKQTVHVMVDANTSYNTRQASANFRPKGVNGYDDTTDSQWTITVVQEGYREKFRVIPDDVTLPVKAGTLDIDITTTDTWTAKILNAPAWVRAVAETTSGAGNGKLSIAFDENTTTKARSAKVRVSYQSVSSVEFTLVQPGRALRPNAEVLYFFAKGGTTTVRVDADGLYTPEVTKGDWISLKDTGNNTFTVTAAAMEGQEERTGSIRLTMKGLASGSYTLTIPVVQMSASGFTRGGFSEDKDLHIGTAPGFSFNVIQYTEDRNWNGTYRATISGEGYDKDENWN